MIIPYPHQMEFINDMRNALRVNKYIIGQAFTGFGKTICGAYIAQSAITKGNKIFFTVHRRELITQTAKSFDKFGIDYSYVAAGLPENHDAPCQIVSIDTAKNRIGKMPVPNIVIVDEAHLGNSAGYKKVIDHWKSQGAYLIGLTATPCRLDGTGLCEIADNLIFSKPVKWLIENKYISEYKYFAPSTPDLSSVSSRMGDYANNELSEEMDKPQLIGDVVKHYRKLCDGKLAVAFCCNVKHAESTARQLTESGVNSAVITGNTPANKRREIINDFADGKIKVLCNCEIITVGFDLASQVDRDVTIDAVLLLRPTQSLSLYLQMVGRGLRAKKYHAVILDFAGCALIHGLPCQDREWSLEGRKKQKRDAETDILVKQCNICFCAHTPAPVCPECGNVYEIIERKIEHKEGELVEITAEMQEKKQERMNQGRAKSVRDLMNTGMSRKRAEHIIESRIEKERLQNELFDLCDKSMAEIKRMKPKELKKLIGEFENERK